MNTLLELGKLVLLWAGAGLVLAGAAGAWKAVTLGTLTERERQAEHVAQLRKAEERTFERGRQCERAAQKQRSV